MVNPRTAAIESCLLPTIIDRLAQSNPDNIWAEYPSSSTTLEDGFQQVTYAQFARAVDSTAQHIQDVLGRRDTGQPLAYLAPNDPRCSIAVIAAMKAGYSLFLMSERNNIDANLHLFDKTGCAALVTTSSSFPPVRDIASERKVTAIELPSLDKLMGGSVSYIYHKNIAISFKETAFIVHSSGSTGFPKAMYISHGYLARAVRNIGLQAPAGYEMLHSMTGNNRSVLLLPLSHGAGIHFSILNAFFNNSTVILPLPGIPPTGEALLEILEHTHADWAAMAPLTLETISKNAPLLGDIASHLKMLLFAGGSLPKAFGDVISSKIKLLSHLGSSESGPLPTLYRHGFDFERDWNYLQLHPAVGARFDPLPEGTFELVFEKTPKAEPHQTVFTMYPDLDEYRTKDLFTPHPALPDVWTHASRSDDVIVFLSGEKVNPTIFESHVCKHPEISAALMFGRQRLEAGLLIELCDQQPLSTLEAAQAIQRLWPTIQSANHVLPGYAQVTQSHICFTDPGVPVLRTLKGSIRRHATLDQYAEKINRLYINVEETWTPGSSQQDLGTMEAILSVVRESLREVTSLRDIQGDKNFFHEGMNSLQVLRLVRQLRIKTALGSVQPSTVYLHPSITALSGQLHELVHKGQESKTRAYEKLIDKRVETLQRYLNKVDAFAPIPTAHRHDSSNENKVVLLTGSTGSIGSYILNSLLLDPKVSHIYCLNRSSDSASLQKERNAITDPALPSTFSENRVTFLTANLSKPQTLGLLQTVYENLCDLATHVIHNSWMMNFNRPLKAYEDQLDSVVNLIRFCAQSKYQAAFTFISSISAVMDYHATEHGEGRIPESIIMDIHAPAAVGYGESKYISERLLSHAVQEHKIRSATILRLGQVAGAARSPGRWNTTDWIPAMVRSSQHLSVLPNSLVWHEDDVEVHEGIDWLPIDTAADSIVEISLQPTNTNPPEREQIRVFNLRNPQRTSWRVLLPSIISAIEDVSAASETEQSARIQVVEPKTWIAKLRASALALMEANISDKQRDALISANPGLRLMDLFSEWLGPANTRTKQGYGSATWETSKAVMASQKLKNAERIDSVMMDRWVKQWCTKA